MILKDKNILLAVTGSIAIYKSLELIRLFIKAGANVKVILSDGAKKFINPIIIKNAIKVDMQNINKPDINFCRLLIVPSLCCEYLFSK